MSRSEDEPLLSRMVYLVASIAERDMRLPGDRSLSWTQEDGLQYDHRAKDARLYRAPDMAALLGQSPAVLRRHLASLIEAGILRVHQGRNGGYAMARPAESVTVYSIWAALYATSPAPPPPPPRLAEAKCPIRIAAAQRLTAISVEMDKACRNAMEAVTIADVLADAGRGLSQFFEAVRGGAVDSV